LDDHIYQVGLSSDTIYTKLVDDLSKTAKQVKDALETLQAEIAAGRMPPNAHFKFGYTVQGKWVPDPSPGFAIDNFNTELKRLYALESRTPPQLLEIGDFEPKLLKNP
jgi:hypothetical protein